MPIREYECNNCKKIFDHLEMTTICTEGQGEPVKCPRCECVDVTRRVSTYGGYSINGNNSASTTPKKR